MVFEWQALLILFLLRLGELTSLTFFLSPILKRKKGRLFIPLVILFASLLLVVINEMVYHVDWEGEFVFMSFLYYPIILLFLMTVYNISLKEGLYFLLLYFLSVHALRILVIQGMSAYFHLSFLAAEITFLENLVITALILIFLNIVFWLLKPFVFRHPDHHLTWYQLGFSFIATIPVIYMTNLFLVMRVNISEIPFSALAIGLVCSICGMVIVIGYNNTLALAKDKKDVAVLETLLATQEKQYQLKKETIDLINAKYHDLKKQIKIIAAIDSIDERETYLENIKNQISVYDAFHNSGNDTLDIVLADKDMECRKAGINLLTFIDGAKLDFLRPLDIVTIFSNALDNSIEAVKMLSESERTISVRMREYDTWMTINFENPFNGKVKWKGERLISLKLDSDEHGFGLLNIKKAVSGYGGNVTVEAQSNQFILTILFPKR
ncbi:MAG: sensor histidine kinase [Anaerolineaceae bacterium]|nr:sensor histidine kinase [Anaerolineaceae bacterium]